MDIKICLVLVTNNNRKSIKNCIESCISLLDQCLIFDLNSTDNTLYIIKKITKLHNIPTNIIEKKNYRSGPNCLFSVDKNNKFSFINENITHFLHLKPNCQLMTINKESLYIHDKHLLGMELEKNKELDLSVYTHSAHSVLNISPDFHLYQNLSIWPTTHEKKFYYGSGSDGPIWCLHAGKNRQRYVSKNLMILDIYTYGGYIEHSLIDKNSRLLLLILSVNDELFSLSSSCSPKQISFITILLSLSLELQMTICNYCYDINRFLIKSHYLRKYKMN